MPTIGVDAQTIPCNAVYSPGLLHGDIFAVTPKPEFDFILLLDVIEHIEKDRDFLRHVSQFLKPGGFIVVTTPAFQSLWSPVDVMA